MSLRVLRPRLTAAGRGAYYPLWRGALESALRVAYAGGWPARVWGRFPAARRVRVVHHELSLLGGTGARLRLAFASDLHLGPTTARATLDRAFEALARAEADVLLLGGDFVFLDATSALMAELTERIAALPTPLKLAVLGNHDLWAEHQHIESALANAGVRVLVNEAVRLAPPFDELAILGLDDPWTGRPDPERALSECGDARVRIALTHSPDGLAFLEGRSIALLLSGHTHGGHLALPGGRPVLLPPGPYSSLYPAGLYDVGGTRLFVSRGIGATEVPMRSYAPPEIALFDLR